MRQAWRNYLHDFRRQWRVLIIFAGLMLVVTWANADLGSSGPLAIVALTATALIVALPLYLLYVLPFGALRMFILGGLVMAPIIGAMFALLRALNVAAIVPTGLFGVLAFTLSFGILMLPLRIPVFASRRIGPDTLLVFEDGDLQTELFNRIRPAQGRRFPDPMLMPAEQTAADTFRAPVRVDMGRSNGDQMITVIDEAPPNSLVLRVEMKPAKAKRSFVIDQRWQFSTLPDGAVRVSIRQRANWGLLSTLTMIIGDSVGDWLEAVLTWASGGEMRALYGRVVNRRVARAARNRTVEGV